MGPEKLIGQLRWLLFKVLIAFYPFMLSFLMAVHLQTHWWTEENTALHSKENINKTKVNEFLRNIYVSIYIYISLYLHLYVCTYVSILIQIKIKKLGRICINSYCLLAEITILSIRWSLPNSQSKGPCKIISYWSQVGIWTKFI